MGYVTACYCCSSQDSLRVIENELIKVAEVPAGAHTEEMYSDIE
jgi:hypothetical protein